MNLVSGFPHFYNSKYDCRIKTEVSELYYKYFQMYCRSVLGIVRISEKRRIVLPYPSSDLNLSL